MFFSYNFTTENNLLSTDIILLSWWYCFNKIKALLLSHLYKLIRKEVLNMAKSSCRRTSKKLASAAGTILRDKRSSKLAKRLAGSVLSQRSDKCKK